MRVCSVDGCRRRHSARGLCKTHYKRAYERKPTTRVRCLQCRSEFDARNDELRAGKGRYCSQRCYHAADETTEARRRGSRNRPHTKPAECSSPNRTCADCGCPIGADSAALF
jgi:hypothetical protein